MAPEHNDVMRVRLPPNLGSHATNDLIDLIKSSNAPLDKLMLASQAILRTSKLERDGDVKIFVNIH